MKKLTIITLLAITGCALFSAPGEVKPLSLTWDFNDPADNVIEYRIYRVDGSEFTLVATAPGTTNVVTFVPSAPGTKTYVATAVNAYEESLPSNDVRTTPSNNPKNLTKAE
jgi:hypothetical protein